MTKNGVCHQCVELTEFFQVPGPASAGIRDGSFDERLIVIRGLNSLPVGQWHRALLELADKRGPAA
jgi:hypothetical protein